MKNIILLTILLASLFSQYEIEGRWHLVGYEDNVMYQFENNLRYSIYSLDGTFGGLEDAGGSPNPYTITEDIITINFFFGNIVNYQLVYTCDGQVVEFRNIDNEAIHSILYREGYDYISNNCSGCFDFTGINFGACTMVLGVGLSNNECSYISGCDWTIDGIDYSDLFFNSMDECEVSCGNGNQCEVGFVEINDLCFHEGDIDVIQTMINNSYQSEIDLGCQEGDPYCGSPNPFMDSPDNWGWISFDGISYEMPGNTNGIIEPLELGIQQWENGRLTSFMCGAYIYCQLSGPIPETINNLTKLETFRVEGNYFNGFVPESICDLEINYNDNLQFDIRYNQLCPPFPDCIDTDGDFWEQYDSVCSEIGDVNYDGAINILDVISLVSFILDDGTIDYQTLMISDLNSDGVIDVLDIVEMVEIIIN